MEVNSVSKDLRAGCSLAAQCPTHANLPGQRQQCLASHGTALPSVGLERLPMATLADLGSKKQEQELRRMWNWNLDLNASLDSW